MSTRKAQASLLLFALISCFMMAAHAQPPVALCSLCLYAHNTNTAYDPNQGACFGVSQSPNQPGGGPLSTPFVGDDNGFTIDSFRYVGLKDCDYCTMTAYPSADLSGKSAVIEGNGGGMIDDIGGTVKYSSVGFCAKSLYFYCDASTVGVEEEEEAEEWEEEE